MRTFSNTLHRAAFKKTYRLLRVAKRLSSKKHAEHSPPLRILMNAQIDAHAGIARVVTSLSSQVRLAGRHVEFVCLSSGLTTHTRHANKSSVRSSVRWRAYERPFPVLSEVLEGCETLAEAERSYHEHTEELATIIREEKPDVVLVNGTYAMPWCLVRAARKMRVPFAVYYHGSLTKETASWHEKKKKKIIGYIERSFYSPLALYIFPSNLIKTYVEDFVFKHAIARKNTLVLPNPIPDVFFNVKKGRAAKRIAFVGRWTHIKNVEFLERFAKTNARSRSPFTIHIITDARGRKEAKRIFGKHVVIHEPIEKPERMSRFYADMDVLICPSFFETYGNVVQEAIASGTPALTSEGTGVAEILKRIGMSYCIVDMYDHQKVLRKVQTLRKRRVPALVRTKLAELTLPSHVQATLLARIEKHVRTSRVNHG